MPALPGICFFSVAPTSGPIAVIDRVRCCRYTSFGSLRSCARSSIGQSVGLRSRRLGVRLPPGIFDFRHVSRSLLWLGNRLRHLNVKEFPRLRVGLLCELDIGRLLALNHRVALG